VVCCHAATAPAADLEAPAAAAAAPAAAAQAPAPAEQQPQPVAASSSDAAPQPTATPAADTTTTTATSSSSSSSKKETGASNAIRVSKAAQPDKVASSILLQLRDAPEAPVILSSVGPEACAVAHKAIVLARALLRDSMPGQQLQYQPQRSRATIKEDAKENKEATSLVAYSYYVTASADTPLDTTPSSSSSSSSKGSDNPVIKISAKTKPYAAAIAITSRMRDHGAATLAAVGSAAIYATHQALSTSRLASIEEHGFDFQVVPALGAQEGLQGVVATFKLVKCAPRTTRRRRPSSRKPSRR
jgi:stage V sporulation protein SpoVS